MIANRYVGHTVVLLLALLASACVPLEPYRVERASVDCTPAQGGVAPACRDSIVERTPQYDLYFVEYDDQGLQYPRERYGDDAAFQINFATRELAQTLKDRGVSLVVYVHGWQHNARHDDANVASFRSLLAQTAAVEAAQRDPYRVVGLYVSWRGASSALWPFDALSFWTRKNAALHVAQGSSRELFSRLRGIACAANRSATESDCRKLIPGKRPRMRMMMIGHSFGGLILYNAISGSLMESLAHAADVGDADEGYVRYGDLVVLVNPAFEATRYLPLHRMASTAKYSHYQAPLFVSITTQADWATGLAFPAGRHLSTFFERYASDEERVANTHTPGHIEDLVTHELTVTDRVPEACRDWRRLGGLEGDALREQIAANRRAEQAVANAFIGDHGAKPDGWERVLCGGLLLQHRRHPANSVVWNVRTTKDVMSGHGDILNEALTSFMRQIYHDVVIAPRLE